LAARLAPERRRAPPALEQPVPMALWGQAARRDLVVPRDLVAPWDRTESLD
jgi:hypothetical protein